MNLKHFGLILSLLIPLASVHAGGEMTSDESPKFPWKQYIGAALSIGSGVLLLREAYKSYTKKTTVTLLEDAAKKVEETKETSPDTAEVYVPDYYNSNLPLIAAEFIEKHQNLDRYLAVGAQLSDWILLSGPFMDDNAALVRAIADNYSKDLYSVDLSTVGHQSIDAQMKAIQKLIVIFCDYKAGTILYINNLESLTVIALKELLTGLKQLTNKPIVIASTADLKKVPLEICSVEYFNTQIRVFLPNKEERSKIFNHYFDEYPIDIEDEGKYIEQLADLTQKFSRKEIKDVMNQAACSAGDVSSFSINLEMLLQAMAKVKNCITNLENRFYQGDIDLR